MAKYGIYIPLRYVNEPISKYINLNWATIFWIDNYIFLILLKNFHQIHQQGLNLSGYLKFTKLIYWYSVMQNGRTITRTQIYFNSTKTVTAHNVNVLWEVLMRTKTGKWLNINLNYVSCWCRSSTIWITILFWNLIVIDFWVNIVPPRLQQFITCFCFWHYSYAWIIPPWWNESPIFYFNRFHAGSGNWSVAIIVDKAQSIPDVSARLRWKNTDMCVATATMQRVW